MIVTWSGKLFTLRLSRCDFVDNLILLVFEHGLSFGSILVIKLSDGKTAFYRVTKIYRLLERKIHSRCQPANLAIALPR